MATKISWIVISVASLLLIICNNACFAEKILVPVFISTRSHKLTYMPLLEELAKRGHNITILSPITSTKKIENITEILTIDAEKSDQFFIKDPLKMREQKTHQLPFTNIEWITKMCRDTFDLPQVKSLMEEKFDLIFYQPLLNDCVLGLVYRVNAPLVVFTPVAVPNWIAQGFGVYFPPSFNPNLFSGFSSEMTFRERLVNFGLELWMHAFTTFYYSSALQAVLEEKVGKDVPHFSEIGRNASLLLGNGHFSLHGHKPLPSDIIEVGGLHSRPPKAVPKNLEDFINKGKEGFIYFSMGSAIKGHTMSEEKRRLFLNVFAKLKQQVIWKWETETMPDLPSNVMLSKFLPQQDLLGHKDIKLFISHCGGGSTEETIYHGVPLIALPIFGDQMQNAKLARGQGFAIELDWSELTEEALFTSIQEILKNPKYQENVKKLSAIYSDQPQSAMERAVYWVEYIIRHKGATHLRSPGRKLNYFQYHSIDVMITYFAIIASILFIIYKLVSCTLRAIIRRCFSKKSAGKRKRD